MDAASRHFFVACGVPPWREIEKDTGVIGTPLVDAQARFFKPASYGDRLEVDSQITEWRNKSFVMRHVVRRGADVLVECTEVRVFARRVEGDPLQIRAVPVPADIRALCSIKATESGAAP
jgi:4-hydroxybenzoyl-CoA thioesterase